MYIGEDDSRGIVICLPKEKMQPQHAMFKAKPTEAPTSTKNFMPAPHRKNKNKSPNIALITTSVIAAVLVTCITLASAGKYLLKNNRYIVT